MEPTGGSGRRIPLTPEVAQRLRQWPKTVGTKLVFCKTGSPDIPVGSEDSPTELKLGR